MMNRPFASFARPLIENGYSPIPLYPITKRPALWGWSHHCEEVLREAEIRRLIDAETPYGVSVATGYNDLIAIDIDTDEEEVLDALRPVIPKSNVGKRGAKGKSLLFRGRAKARKFTSDNRMLLEILGVGNHTVIPPSIHPDTRAPYNWLSNRDLLNTRVDELRELPPDIGDRIGEALRPWLRFSRRGSEPRGGEFRTVRVRPDPHAPYIASTIAGVQADLASTQPGARNITLNGAAFRLGQLGFGIDEVEELLSDIACDIGLSPSEAARTIASGVTAGARYPRGRSVR